MSIMSSKKLDLTLLVHLTIYLFACLSSFSLFLLAWNKSTPKIKSNKIPNALISVRQSESTFCWNPCCPTSSQTWQPLVSGARSALKGFGVTEAWLPPWCTDVWSNKALEIKCKPAGSAFHSLSCTEFYNMANIQMKASHMPPLFCCACKCSTAAQVNIWPRLIAENVHPYLDFSFSILSETLWQTFPAIKRLLGCVLLLCVLDKWNLEKVCPFHPPAHNPKGS